MRRTFRPCLFLLFALVLATSLRGDMDAAARAQMLADPGYKAFEDARAAILRSGLKGEARYRALKANQDAHWPAIQKAFGARGLTHVLSSSVSSLPEGVPAPAFTMEGDTRVYTPPFSHRVANSGDASADGHVVAQADTFDGSLSNVTFRSYAGVAVTVPAGAVAMIVSAEVEVTRIDLYTEAVYTGASARSSVMAEAKGSLPGDGFWDTLLIQQDAPAFTFTHWGSYGNPGLKHVTSTVTPVTPGQTAYAAGGLTAWVKNGYNSDAHVGASGIVRRILVRFLYPPPPTATPLQALVYTPTPLQALVYTPTPLQALVATPGSPVVSGAALKLLAGPADLALTATPPGSGWPTQLVVKNVFGKTSESTLVRAKVVLLQGDIDVVAQNCQPRFVDFDEAVPALAPGASTSISLLTKIGPDVLAAWKAINKPVRPRGRPVPTPTPNPVETIVVCRYRLTAELGGNQNVNDPQKANNKLTRDIVENVPLK